MLGASLLAQRGGVLGDHLGVHRESAGGDDHRIRLDRTGFGEVLPCDADDRAVVDDEVGCAGFIPDLHPELGGPLEQQLDDHRRATQFAGHRHRVSPRSGCRLLAERPHLLVAGVRQAFGARRDDHLARVVAPLELKAQVLQPIEVFDAAVTVGADLVVLWIRRHRDQVLVHLLGRIVVPGGLLDRRSAAEVEVTAGHRRGSAGCRRAFEHQHFAPCRGRADRRAPAGDAEAEHHDVDVIGPGRDLAGVDGGGDLGAHTCSCLM